MSNKRYIEVYSARRNRNLYPFVSSFQIPIEESGLKSTAATAFDPVLLAFPSYQFKLNEASSTPPTSPIYNFPGGGAKKFGSLSPYVSTRANPILDTNPSSGTLYFYNGYRLIDVTINESRIIVNYDATNGKCTLNKPFSEAFKATDCYITQDPSVPFLVEVISQTTPSGGPTYYISGTAANPILYFNGANITPPPPTLNFSTNSFPCGYFQGYYLQILDGTTGLVVEERKIDDFVQLGVGSEYYQVSLDNDFIIPWSWSNLENKYFKITTQPTSFIHLQPADVYNFNNPAIYDQFYTGDYVFNEKTNEGVKISGYNATLRFAGLTTPFTPSSDFNPLIATIAQGPTGFCCPDLALATTGTYGPTGPNDTPYFNCTGSNNAYFDDSIFSIRKELPCYVGGLTGSFAMGDQVVCFNPLDQKYRSLPNENGAWGRTSYNPGCCTTLTENNEYLYLRPISYSYTDIPSAKNVYLIKQYYGSNGGTGPCTSNCPGIQTYPPYCAILDRPIEVSTGTGTVAEVLKFSYDNFAPFCYNGSKVSQQEQVCYEIQLISLVLPNVTLKSGSRISFYPFVYVQFGTTVGSSMNHSDCIIYSNNPKSKKALFVAPTTDVSNPLTSQFIKLDGNGATETIKFKPNENLVFSVFLPNGELFLPVISDNYSPLPPNPLVQIEAYFSIKRL